MHAMSVFEYPSTADIRVCMQYRHLGVHTLRTFGMHVYTIVDIRVCMQCGHLGVHTLWTFGYACLYSSTHEMQTFGYACNVDSQGMHAMSTFEYP